MLNSGKNVKELSNIFGISEDILCNWKMKSKTKVKTKSKIRTTCLCLGLISENERLKNSLFWWGRIILFTDEI
jgi:hypothetical protein